MMGKFLFLENQEGKNKCDFRNEKHFQPQPIKLYAHPKTKVKEKVWTHLDIDLQKILLCFTYLFDILLNRFRIYYVKRRII